MNKVLMLGWDGATWTLLRPWIDQGLLPNLARLIAGGASGPLTTTIPPVSASAWISFATGCNRASTACSTSCSRAPALTWA
jgi:predicted AlkP superfamily phosphohydrolase/phosphomutase